jgi:8-oxo-dGTP pyrophosphatase MutT (NUDIX family)
VSNASTPRPASTVLVVRDGAAAPEVFMVRRHQDNAAFSGAHVFPGGRVDERDHHVADPSWCDGVEAASRALPDLGAEGSLAYAVAAARELFEEAGVLLARDARGRALSLASPSDHERFKAYRNDVHAGRTTLHELARREGFRLGLDMLCYYAHWVTPAVEGRRFDTRFFLARLPPHQTPAHDDNETTHGSWLTARHALQAALGREIVLPPPTWTTLRELEPFASVDALLAGVARRRIRRREPRMLQEDGRRVLLMPGDPDHQDSDSEPVDSETRFVWDDGRWLAEPRRVGGRP